MSDKKRIFDDEKEMPLASISADDMRWNRTGSWRNVKPFYDPKTSPCIAGCPAGEDIQSFIQLAQEEKYEEAVRKIWESNPFPAVCGRVCYHPCMDSCARGQFDESVFIPAIERFLGDYAVENGVLPEKPEVKETDRIAVIGGGPSGMACAFFLARDGFPVTLFESKPRLGGVLRYGIPEYRLPKDVLDSEIFRLTHMGVDIKTNTTVGKDISVEDLGDYSAYFVGIGLQKSRALGLENEDAKGVMPGLAFLEKINNGEKVEVGERVVVIGGGNTAMDVARTALRQRAHVTVLYRRTRDEMPAIDDEVHEARGEGVNFHFLAQPVQILTVDGRIHAVMCQEMELGEPDDSGRRRPMPTDSYFTLPADSLLVAAGELPVTEGFDRIAQIENGLIVTDEFGRTTHDKVFAGGDIVSGASTVVNAVARGRGAAELIAAKLRHEEFDPRTDKKVVAIADINSAYFLQKRRQSMRHADGAQSDRPFDEVNIGLTCDQVQTEMDRCFSCGVCDGCDNCYVFCPDVAISRNGEGVYTIDYDFCKGCLICVQECPRGVISVESEAN